MASRAVEPDATAVRRRARLLYSARDVSRAIKRMAREIESTLRGANPVVLAVMHGGVFTAVNLCARFKFPYEFDYVHVTRYANRLTGGELDWRVRPSAKLAGRTVLIVEDILDRGLTLMALQEELRQLGVARQYTVALAIKQLGNRIERPRVDFSCFTIEDVYVFGCGMDYQGYWRGLRGLYAIDA
ncbi:MAG TPA: hypoxanthine-guanine phosphoribosyltransferase [Gammaproteobacteria bacterium]|nr:hypoxanthine-guanine phosphoribosyltransferase [Gammaproteobacteria bacterium]